MGKCHPCHPPVPTWPPSARAGRGPADPGNRMVGRALTGNGTTATGDGHDSLIGGAALSDAERDALQQLCRQRLDAFHRRSIRR